MVRCKDFVGAARGTLAVVSDAGSVCGQVVHESQLLPYATSAGFGSPFLPDYEYVDTSLADTTLSIPVADLNLEAGISYVAFVGLKIVGAGDINHRVGEEFISLADQNARVRAYNDSIDDGAYPSISPPLPRPETNPAYRLKWFQSVSWVTSYHRFDGGGTNPTDFLVVAAAGEDSSYEFYLDAIYLLPFESDSVPGQNYILAPADLTAWDPLEDDQTGDPHTTRDNDDNDTTNALNILATPAGYSAMYAEPNGYGTGFLAPGGDYQRAQSEAIAHNINNFGLWNGVPSPAWPDDPRSWIPMTVSLVVVPAQTIETETFSTDHSGVNPPRSFLSTSGEYYWTTVGGNSSTTSVAGGVLDFDNIECLTIDARTLARFGDQSFPLPLTGSPSHSEIRESVFDLSSGIIESAVTIESEPDNGQMYAWVGWENHVDTSASMNICGVALYLDGGDLKATLRTHGVYDPQFGTTRYARGNFGTSPVTVDAGHSLGDTINVLVERRYYVWRAKVWMAGDAEPSGWTLEGLQPNFYPDATANPTVLNLSLYPYSNDNLDEWGSPVRVYMGQFPCLGVVTDVQTGSAAAFGHVTFSSFALSYDPVGVRDTAHISLEKYDGSVQYGSADFDTDRVIIASLSQHTFDDDTHGFNVYLWSDAGAAELQSASATDFIMRAPVGRVFGRGPVWL